MENEFENVSFNNNDDWGRYKLYVIEALKRLRKEVDDLQKNVKTTIEKLGILENKIVVLQVKSGVWGLAAGILGVILMTLLKGKFGI